MAGTLTSWCVIETVGNALLSLCIYYERVHNHKFYRGYRDRMLSAGAFLFLLHNLTCGPLIVYRVLSGQGLSAGICLGVSTATIFTGTCNSLFLLNYLLSVLIDNAPSERYLGP